MLLDLESLINKYNVEIEGVIQPGAHYGQEQDLYDRLKIPYENRYYYEPQREVFKILEKNISDKGSCFNFALGNNTSRSLMFTEKNNQSMSSSLLRPKIHVEQYPHIKFDSNEYVNVFRLDDVFPLNRVNRKWLLNIDCQGFELEVLRGATKVLPYVQAIICEVNRAEVYEGCPMVEEIDEFLKEFSLERKEVSWEGITWGDALYIR